MSEGRQHGAEKGEVPGTVLQDAEGVLAKERAHIEAKYAPAFDAAFPEYLANDYRRFVEEDYPEQVREHHPGLDPAAYPHPRRPWYGLALSGGGIRSASFAIGVIQALRNRNLFPGKPSAFDKLAYLSTASGGGYASGALSWFLRRHGIFPFGDVGTYAGSQYSQSPSDRTLSYLRQHGKYLTPAQLKWTSLIAAILLSILHSVFAYILILTAFSLLLTCFASWSVVEGVLDALPFHNGMHNLFERLPAHLASLRVERNLLDEDKINFSSLFLSLAAAGAVLFLLAVLLNGLLSYTRRWFSAAYCYRVKLQRLLGMLLKAQGFFLFFALLPVAAILIFGDSMQLASIGPSVASGLAGVALALRNFRQHAEKAKGEGVVNLLFTALASVVLTFLVFLAAYLLAEELYDATKANRSLLAAAMLLRVGLALLVATVVNINQVSPHKMYRDRLMETFLKAPEVSPRAPLCEIGREANRSLLAELAQPEHWSPYPLINCNIILNNARQPRFRGRGGDSFLLSPLYCGSDATRYIPTPQFHRGELTLPTAMSISGAAENPHASVAGNGKPPSALKAFLMTFLGLRLGFWSYNPLAGDSPLKRWMPPNYILPGFYSLLNFGHREDSLFIELSDGGHFDNTAVYELVRRRVPVIILSDASADPRCAFSDLGNMIERVRVDFGVNILFNDERFDLSGLLPGSQASLGEGADRLYDEKYGLSERGYAIGDIVYPALPGQPAFVGRFIYIKASLTRQLPADLYAYKATFPSYCNEPTVDQFFDERQFEAYRELGYQLTRQFLKNPAAARLLP